MKKDMSLHPSLLLATFARTRSPHPVVLLHSSWEHLPCQQPGRQGPPHWWNTCIPWPLQSQSVIQCRSAGTSTPWTCCWGRYEQLQYYSCPPQHTQQCCEAHVFYFPGMQIAAYRAAHNDEQQYVMMVRYSRYALQSIHGL